MVSSARTCGRTFQPLPFAWAHGRTLEDFGPRAVVPELSEQSPCFSTKRGSECLAQAMNTVPNPSGLPHVCDRGSRALRTASCSRRFKVNTLLDTVAVNLKTGKDASGHISLRSAIEAANAKPNSDTILLPNGTIKLTIAGCQRG